MSLQEEKILAAEALKELTFSVVKEKLNTAQVSSTTTACNGSSPKNAKEPHPKVFHSVLTKDAPKQLRRNSTSSGACEPLAHPTVTTTASTFSCSSLLNISIVPPPPSCHARRQLSSSVDSSIPSLDYSLLAHMELEEKCVISDGERNATQLYTQSLDTESSVSGGSGKATPCNIPGHLSYRRTTSVSSQAEEKLVSSYPPGPVHCHPPFSLSTTSSYTRSQQQIRVRV